LKNRGLITVSQSPWRVDDPLTAASIIRSHWQLDFDTGALFAAPIPSQYEAVGAKLQDAVERAIAESEENGVSKRGKEATPWLLKRVGELTAGSSLASNVALIENTAAIGKWYSLVYAADCGDLCVSLQVERSRLNMPNL
jgi:pseudouridylate synthase / pseudouridine kinase